MPETMTRDTGIVISQNRFQLLIILLLDKGFELALMDSVVARKSLICNSILQLATVVICLPYGRGIDGIDGISWSSHSQSIALLSVLLRARPDPR